MLFCDKNTKTPMDSHDCNLISFIIHDSWLLIILQTSHWKAIALSRNTLVNLDECLICSFSSNPVFVCLSIWYIFFSLFSFLLNCLHVPYIFFRSFYWSPMLMCHGWYKNEWNIFWSDYEMPNEASTLEFFTLIHH